MGAAKWRWVFLNYKSLADYWSMGGGNFFWSHVFIFLTDSLTCFKQLCQRNHIFWSNRWFSIKYFSSEFRHLPLFFCQNPFFFSKGQKHKNDQNRDKFIRFIVKCMFLPLRKNLLKKKMDFDRKTRRNVGNKIFNKKSTVAQKNMASYFEIFLHFSHFEFV